MSRWETPPLKAGSWILKTPFVFVIILAGFTFDHVVREVLTLNGEYYRTTVLSFKGLSFNLAYGSANILYAGLVTGLRKVGIPQEEVFERSLAFFPGYFAVVAVITAVVAVRMLRESKQHLRAG